MTNTQMSSGSNGRKKGMTLFIVIAIFILLTGILFAFSFSNRNTYRLLKEDDTLTLWKGKMAPRGLERVESFEPLAVGQSDPSLLTSKGFAGKEAMYEAIFDFMMVQIAGELEKGEEANLEQTNKFLNKAEAVLNNNLKASSNQVELQLHLASARMAVAELTLQKAYEKALPVYEEALKKGLGHTELLESQIEAAKTVLDSSANR